MRVVDFNSQVLNLVDDDDVDLHNSDPHWRSLKSGKVKFRKTVEVKDLRPFFQKAIFRQNLQISTILAILEPMCASRNQADGSNHLKKRKSVQISSTLTLAAVGLYAKF